MNLEKFRALDDHNVFINAMDDILEGIVFLYPPWSIDQRYLKVLSDCIKAEKVNYPLYIYDLEHPSALAFQKKYYVLSQGKGEVYFIKKGQILFRIEEHNKEHPEAQINKVLAAYKIK